MSEDVRGRTGPARGTGAELREVVSEARALAGKLGLDGYPVDYWLVDYDEMNRLMAYDGFPERYPHWRWGMKYDRLRKQNRYAASKAFEIIVNDDPSHAYLQESNSLADQKAVITHVEAHADFFKNNRWYRRGGHEEGAVNMLERHASRIRSIMRRPDVERDEVERFIDDVLSVADAIDQHRPYAPSAEADPEDDEVDEEYLDDLGLIQEVREAVFDREWVDDRDSDGPSPEPASDVLAFLCVHGKQYDPETGKAVEMEGWQREVAEILRREAYYFAPQRMTKVMNEGWACVAPDTLTFTNRGLVPMSEVVAERPAVSDGETARGVYDSNVIPDHDTVSVTTRRGFELTGSNDHRIRRPDGSWVRLDDLAPGDEIAVSGGNGLWPREYAAIDWELPQHVTLHDVAEAAGVSVWTVMRYRDVGRARRAGQIEEALEAYGEESRGIAHRTRITVPAEVTEPFGRFLGLLVGDGHVSTGSRHVGFTTGMEVYADEFAELVEDLFGVEPAVEQQGSRFRVYAYSEDLNDLLVEALGLPEGEAADRKTVPDQILRSPEPVVAEFLRGLFDADGYAGKQGAILSTKSEEMSKLVQLLLANFGVLSRRRERGDGCFHVHVTGRSASTFADSIGFGYPEKQERLLEYVDDRSWFEKESWTDEVVDIETGTGDVYDVSVEDTHRYAGAGFVNHNSYWESVMMGEEAFADADEFVQYAEHQSRVLGSPGLNPYKLGKELWEHIENVENRREVIRRLLCVEGVTPENVRDVVDFDDVLRRLEPAPPLDAVSRETLPGLADVARSKVDQVALDRALSGEIDVDRFPWKVLTYAGLAERHFSLTKARNRGFLRSVGREEVERIGRYLVEDERYSSVEEAVDDVEYTAGWEKLFEVRAGHNDVTFLDAFLSAEFVRRNGYFAYEYSHATGDFRATSSNPEDVKKKLLLRFANFGKPTIVVEDGNYENRNELLLAHRYNGVQLDRERAEETLKRVFSLWGRPVNLKTIVRQLDDRDRDAAARRGEEPTPEERGLLLRYDGDEVEAEELRWDDVEDIAATDVDYDTKPDDWL